MVSTTAATITAPFVRASLPTFVEICGQLAPPMSVLLSAAPLPTIRGIQQAQDVGSLPLLPYTCMAASCTLWAVYGFLKKQSSIWAPNLIGLGLGLYYLRSFIRFSPPESPTLPGTVQQHLSGLVALGVAILGAVLASVKPAIVGQLAVLFCIALFASPLASLQTVLRTKSARSIPLPFTLVSLVNCFLWTVTGVLKLKDANIIIPNVLGMACGLAQVSLKLVYGNREHIGVMAT
eukprot:CAMPEP_0118691472 /NCGR_PEP_ID=MMETSP0800-20121206/10699_1 /TAXON_ID=210618 ORGANISM="Striatella unipunctata, Strain CCMP2910" /NCGR_SAMPLE_ID=MMETSP0800 /ASSEMBLY_ACC=CAM_ASM_000638 /LENGTH=234 /DNA_ID=CAMNT_0006589255 /DNA_START=261 /DNA_END=965 /DNA_ORIENTATION=-